MHASFKSHILIYASYVKMSVPKCFRRAHLGMCEALEGDLNIITIIINIACSLQLEEPFNVR